MNHLLVDDLCLDAGKAVFSGLLTTKAQTSLQSVQTDQRLYYLCFGKYHI